jgi:hypothetical protein
MLLTITAGGCDSEKLGYLLAKHPNKCQRFELSYGAAYVVGAAAGGRSAH